MSSKAELKTALQDCMCDGCHSFIFEGEQFYFVDEEIICGDCYTLDHEGEIK